MKTIYSIHEYPTYDEKQNGLTVGCCICEECDKDKAIESAREYYSDRSEQDDNGEKEVIVIAYNEDDDTETTEEILLNHNIYDNFCPHKEWGTMHSGGGGVL